MKDEIKENNETTIYDYKFVSIKDIKNQLQYKKIKEILDYLNIKGKKMIGIKQKELLLDYITNLQEENEELKMTNLALADDITKNKIIKQEVLTECCGIPIGEIPMLKIQNDEYKQRIDKAIEYIKEDMYVGPKELYGLVDGEHLLNILQGKSDE